MTISELQHAKMQRILLKNSRKRKGKDHMTV